MKPDFIIETGTAFGGSALLWAMVLEHVNPKGRVITLDIADQIEVAKLATQNSLRTSPPK